MVWYNSSFLGFMIKNEAASYDITAKPLPPLCFSIEFKVFSFLPKFCQLFILSLLVSMIVFGFLLCNLNDWVDELFCASTHGC